MPNRREVFLLLPTGFPFVELFASQPSNKIWVIYKTTFSIHYANTFFLCPVFFFGISVTNQQVCTQQISNRKYAVSNQLADEKEFFRVTTRVTPYIGHFGIRLLAPPQLFLCQTFVRYRFRPAQ
jgi:hypothetical protein